MSHDASNYFILVKNVMRTAAMGVVLLLAACPATTRREPWADPHYAKDLPATIADSRTEERAKGGWNLFIKHHENRKRWVTDNKVDLLMIGDSIVFGWSRSGNTIWDEYFADRNAVNIGSSGDQTQHMLWHIQAGGLDGLRNRNPKLVFLMIGTNNRGKPENEGRDTAVGILALLKEIHARLPNSTILLSPIFPRGWTPQDQGRIRNDQINEIIRTYADGKTVIWFDINHIFLDKDGNLNKDLMPDALHPSEHGYRAWAAAMVPALNQYLGKR